MAEEAPKAEVKVEPKKEKKKKVNPKIWKFYEVKESSVTRLRQECPRCGKGVFLGKHKDRLTCGKCGYTKFVPKK